MRARKALKVADLKEILKKASVSASPKGTKAELIAKIIAEPAAIDVYNMLHNPAGAALHQDAPSKSKSTNRPVSPSKAEVRCTLVHHYGILNQTLGTCARATPDINGNFYNDTCRWHHRRGL